MHCIQLYYTIVGYISHTHIATNKIYPSYQYVSTHVNPCQPIKNKHIHETPFLPVNCQQTPFNHIESMIHI